MKPTFWKSDWLTSLVIIFAVFLLNITTSVFDSLERSAYDFGVRHSEAIPSNQVAVIAIDDESIANIGRWPWPRSQQAEIINFIAQGEPAVIGYVPLFSEPQTDPGLTYISSMREYFEQSSLNDLAALAEVESDSGLSLATDQNDLSSGIEGPGQEAETKQTLDPFTQRTASDAANLLFTLYEAEDALDADLQLSQAMASAGNVISQMSFGESNRIPAGVPDFISKNALVDVVDRVFAKESNDLNLLPRAMQEVVYPLEEYANAAQRLGHGF